MSEVKYRLKDRKLQEKLDAISGGDFSEKLNTEAQKRFSPVLAREVFTVYFGDFDALANRFSVLFELNEVEEVPEYDPRRWNEWPDVEPPEGVDMRVEVLSKDGKVIFKGASVFITDAWNIGGHRYDDGRVRFRPWDDPDEEGEK